MCDGALGQSGRAFVEGERVRVATTAEAAVRVKPCSGGDLDNARSNAIANPQFGKARAAAVVDANDLSFLQPESAGICGVHCDRLYPIGAVCAADCTMIQLAVQFVAWLV